LRRCSNGARLDNHYINVRFMADPYINVSLAYTGFWSELGWAKRPFFSGDRGSERRGYASQARGAAHGSDPVPDPDIFAAFAEHSTFSDEWNGCERDKYTVEQ
jgi:hypothetical protein